MNKLITHLSAYKIAMIAAALSRPGMGVPECIDQAHELLNQAEARRSVLIPKKEVEPTSHKKATADLDSRILHLVGIGVSSCREIANMLSRSPGFISKRANIMIEAGVIRKRGRAYVPVAAA